MKFRILNDKILNFKQENQSFMIEGHNLNYQGEFMMYFTDHEMNQQEFEVTFEGLITELRFSYILGYKKTFEPEGIHLFIENYKIKLDEESVVIKKFIDKDKEKFLKKVVLEKIEKNLIKTIFTSDIYYSKEVYIKPQELLNKIYSVSDYYKLHKGYFDHSENYYLEFGLTLKDWLPYIQ